MITGAVAMRILTSEFINLFLRVNKFLERRIRGSDLLSECKVTTKIEALQYLVIVNRTSAILIEHPWSS